MHVRRFLLFVNRVSLRTFYRRDFTFYAVVIILSFQLREVERRFYFLVKFKRVSGLRFELVS